MKMQESKRTIITVKTGENGYYLVESFQEKPAVKYFYENENTIKNLKQKYL